MTVVTYLVTTYLMMCVVVFAVVRVSIADRILRTTFLLIGCLAPGFVAYILYRTVCSGEHTTPEEAAQILSTADWIEHERRKKFGDHIFPFKHRLRIECVRALNKTAERIERVVERAA
jgi:hypothetical protein